ncbi:MAG: hypothetical protein H0W74_12750 [Sphingosinicella sp.]|nr:hypothetical protein [Sphingosinicella sp.]
MIEVSVADKGPAIPHALLSEAFSPLHTTGADHIGLGLSISRTIVESHGGRIWGETASDCWTPQLPRVEGGRPRPCFRYLSAGSSFAARGRSPPRRNRRTTYSPSRWSPSG